MWGAKNNYGMKVNLIDTANYQLIKQNYFQSCSEIGQSDWLMRVTAEKGENFFPLFKKSIMLANGFINLLLCCPYKITGQYILFIHYLAVFWMGRSAILHDTATFSPFLKRA